MFINWERNDWLKFEYFVFGLTIFQRVIAGVGILSSTTLSSTEHWSNRTFVQQNIRLT